MKFSFFLRVGWEFLSHKIVHFHHAKLIVKSFDPKYRNTLFLYMGTPPVCSSMKGLALLFFCQLYLINIEKISICESI